MHSLKPFTFTLNLLLLLLTLSSQKPFVDADIEQVTLRDQSSLSLNNNNNNNFFASESNEEDILKRSCTIESNIIATNFSYLMKFGLKRYEGDKGHRYVYATPDTGSNFIWFHSQPCDYLLGCDCSCYDKGECIEKPEKTFGCADQACNDLKKVGINHKCHEQNDNKLCWYKDIKYADDTKSEGFFGHADFQFDKSDETSKINRIALSVGFSTKKKDENVPERNGIVGLGMGGLSLIKQYKGMNEMKFSYYLPQFRRRDEQDIKDRSKFEFGCGVKISDKSTHLLKKQDKYPMCGTHYCVQLKSICLKYKGENCYDHKITVSKGDTMEDNVIVIDSGSTFTHLKYNVFKKLLYEVRKKLGGKGPRKLLFYENCFEKKDGNVEKLENISFEFGGTTIELKRENIFDEYSVPDCNGGEEKTYVCLTVEGENEGYHKRLRSYGTVKGKPQILGSRAQMDFRVAFDLQQDMKKKVSFENLGKLLDHGSVKKVSLENNEKNSVLSE